MTTIDEIYKKFCYEKKAEIAKLINYEMELIETDYDIRLIHKIPDSLVVEVIIVADSFHSIYLALLGINKGLELSTYSCNQKGA